MPHIHKAPGQYDHTCSAFIIKLEKEPRMILHIHKIMGTFLHFGGHIELDESPWGCLVREIREESGYEISQLKILQPEDSLKNLGEAAIHPLPFMHVSYHYKEISHFHSDLKYVFVTKEEAKHRPLGGESEIIKSFTRQEISALPESKLKARDKELCLYVFDYILSKWEAVDPAVFPTS